MIRGALRRIYFRYPGRLIALNRVRVEQPQYTTKGVLGKRPGVFYRCEQCGVLGKSQVGKKNPKGHIRVWVDHKDPVVPLDRYPNWDEFINRLFCSADNFEILCSDCHQTKSKAENAERRKNMGWQTRAKTASDTDDISDSGSDE